MKKISLMLVAAATCAFASCGGNKSNNADVTGVDSAIVVTDSDSDNVGTGVQNQANEVTESTGDSLQNAPQETTGSELQKASENVASDAKDYATKAGKEAKSTA